MTASGAGESKENNVLEGVVKSRKMNKPLMEKRRRARINSSLTKLKELVFDKESQDKILKLEKTNILDRTVTHIQDLHRQQLVHPCFNEGYQECLTAVVKFLLKRKSSLVSEISRFLQDREEKSSSFDVPELPPVHSRKEADIRTLSTLPAGTRADFCPHFYILQEVHESLTLEMPLDLSLRDTRSLDYIGIWRPWCRTLVQPPFGSFTSKNTSDPIPLPY